MNDICMYCVPARDRAKIVDQVVSNEVNKNWAALTFRAKTILFIFQTYLDPPTHVEINWIPRTILVRLGGGFE